MSLRLNRADTTLTFDAPKPQALVLLASTLSTNNKPVPAMRVLWAVVLPFALRALGQSLSCENYGAPNGTSCTCPPGFGNATCSLPSCGGNIFQGSARKTVTVSDNPSTFFGNLTAETDCSCESGWGGFGCNVCQSQGICQSALAALGRASSASSSVNSDPDIAQNSTLTCSNSARVFAAGHMSCQVTVRALVNPIFIFKWLI
jgi:hypothetical protein